MLDEEIESIYWELNKIYSSEHNEGPDEVRVAIDLLKNAVHAHHVSKATLIEKLMQMTRKLNESGMRKTKLFNVIYSRYWEKVFIETVPIREFKEEY